MAAESYATNQWYNLQGGVAGPNTGSGSGPLARTDKDNPEFLFPGKVRKNLGGGPDTTIQRGFIRSLLTEIPEIGKSIPNRRFFFQFNPERIMRSVSVSSGLMNPLLQDPGQFSVATPGNATFSFDILLNREMEVNNATKGMVDPDNAATLRPDMVGEIGVLADLLVMDSIIGQGISDDIINALSRITSISSSWEPSDTSSGASVSDNFISEKDAGDAFKMIKGNSAFLVSTPVRIVFSSMFMVDGFIQGSSVNFTKFSNNMVPTMCAINVTVEAKYIGFAQKDTYLTESLKNAKEADTIVTPITSIKGPEYDLLVSALKESGPYHIAVGGTSVQGHTEEWGAAIKSGFLQTGYNGYATLLRIDPLFLRAGWRYTVEETKTKGIGKLFFSQAYDISFSHTPKVSVWRSFQSEGEKTTAKNNLGMTSTGGQQGGGERVTETWNKITVKRDVLLMEVQGVTVNMSNWSEWQKYYSYGGGDDDYPAGTRGPAGFGGTKDDAKAVDNIINSVANNARSKLNTSDDFMEKFYLEGSAADNSDAVDVLVDIEIGIVAKIKNSNKSESVVAFTYKKSFIEQNVAPEDTMCVNDFTFPPGIIK